MYQAIRERKSVREGYLENLLKLGGVSQTEADEIAVRRRKRLEDALDEAKSHTYTYDRDSGRGVWQGYTGGPDIDVPDADTRLNLEQISQLIARQTTYPDTFEPHPKIKRLMGVRDQMADGKRPFDWGGAEALAFASLVNEGARVRLSGQDSGRGTFSHRHAGLYDYRNGERYVPLQHISPSQAPFEVIDSPLSESGVLGFEYGYSLDCPSGLILWEAQFGDFVNGAQVLIDQFISSSEDKWYRFNALVMLLPHGFEGQGPEHSSGRLERFLTACAEDNMQVCNLTTPAQYFHCLRRQVKRPIRKPLIIMTPKSLLRHPEAVSPLEAFTQGQFQRLIRDESVAPDATRRVLLCSGKIYYDLISAQRILGASHVAIHRFEQIYPLRQDELTALVAGVPAHTPVVWVQEEPANQGAWPFMRYTFGEQFFGHPLTCVSREESASPATGSAASHRMEQELIIEQAFELA
jgi:2-oxoglutarate dehydrogenase E1 component